MSAQWEAAVSGRAVGACRAATLLRAPLPASHWEGGTKGPSPPMDGHWQQGMRCERGHGEAWNHAHVSPCSFQLPGELFWVSCDPSSPELLQWRQLQFTLRAESTLPLLWDLSRGSDTGADPFCTILLGHSEAMKPAQCPVSTWALHVVSSPLSLPTSLVHTQGAGLVQGLWPHSTQSSNYNKSSNVDLSVLHYTDQKLWFLRRKQVFWNMIYFSRRLR